MNKQSFVLLGCVMVVLLCGCGGSSRPAGRAAPAAPASATATVPDTSSVGVPEGYHLVGGKTRGISLAAPSGWVAVNWAQPTIKKAMAQFRLRPAIAAELVRSVQALQKYHAVFIYDFKSAANPSARFLTGLSAYCGPSGFTETGRSAVPIFDQEMSAELQKLHAKDIGTANVAVGGIPGEQTIFTLSTASGPLHEVQLEVAPRADRACFITLSPSPGDFPEILTVAAATARFYG